MKKLWSWGAALIAAMTLVACGGSDRDDHGAIAISESTKRVGMSSEALTQSIANDAARDECDVKDCTVVLQFEECGAIAAGAGASGGWVWGVAEAGTAFDAQTAANNACTAKGGLNCGVIPNLPAQCN